MKKINKFLSVVLSVVMIFSVVSITASAEKVKGDCGANLNWAYDSSTYTLTITGSGDMDNYDDGVYPPWDIYKYNIQKINVNFGAKSIGNKAFNSYNNLTTVKLPGSLKTIGEDAFSNCINLTSVTLGNKVETIGKNAFSFCIKLDSITIPGSVKTIGENAFYYCEDLSEVVIPNGVSTIGANAFAFCSSLSGVSISKSVTTIGLDAFTACESLTGITVDSENESFSNDEYGVLFNKDKTILVQYPIGNTSTSYTIPESVKVVAPNAFAYNSNLTTIILSEGVTAIENGAFDNCQQLSDVYYSGTSADWKKIAIGTDNECLTTASLHFDYCVHKYVGVPTAPTCTERGYTTYTCSECGASYVDDYVTETGHNYSSEITTPATHVTEGVKTFTCADCSYSYTEAIAKTTEHTYEEEITTPATHMAEGVKTFTCECGDTYTEVIEIIAEHTYVPVVTEPTCTENGYTTYTCECKDSYVGDYVDVIPHEYTAETTTPATHLSEGVMTYTCECGDTYTEAIDKLDDHVFETVVTAPTCTEQGYTTYTCVCGETFKRDYVDALGHLGAGDGVCDTCGATVEPDDSTNCYCLCHSTGYVKIFFNIILIFQRILGTNKSCACGIVHY